MSLSEIILASGSSSRRAMLEAAGVRFRIVSPDVDETAITKKLIGQGAAAGIIAETLAEAKANKVSAQHRDTLVIGGDQILVCGTRLFDKATNAKEASETLKALRGNGHSLISAAVLARDGQVVWRHTARAVLHMREFSQSFLDAYLAAEIPDILGSVGCYRFEGRGAQLFDWIEGDQFCIRGLPLIPVLDALRAHGGLLA